MSAQTRTALVTGGGRGIGRASAFALAEAGARVAVLARSGDEVDESVRMLRDAGHHAHGVSADVADIDSFRAAVDDVTARLGPIDVLANNAGVTWPLGAIWEIDTEEWLAAVSINLVGPVRGIRLVLPGMLERGWGRIINVTTGAASPPGIPRASAYSASKAALNQLTCTVAAELATTGVSINAVDPGLVDTAMQDYMRESSDLLGPRVSSMFHRFVDDGKLRDATDPARLIAAVVGSELNGEIVRVGSDQAAELLESAEGGKTQ